MKKRMVTDEEVASITDANVTAAALYLFYAVLIAIAGLAALIVIVAILTVLLGKLGFGNILKMTK
ncbi:MAG TPA: hypothetical protein VMW25_01170 [Clostridia bacterium]|nr:hypothetical protein [Clostridia bacterium]